MVEEKLEEKLKKDHLALFHVGDLMEFIRANFLCRGCRRKALIDSFLFFGPYQLAIGEHEGTLDWGELASSIGVDDSQS